MARKTVKTIAFRRKREKKTNYLTRRQLLMNNKPRLTVRKSLKNISLQIVDYHPNGDKILVSAHSRELIKLGWKGSRKNLPACYCTGLLIAKKAKLKNINEVIPDLGLYRVIYGSKLFAALKGATDGSLKIKINEKVLPKQDRLSGKHISNFKDNFEEVKKKILG